MKKKNDTLYRILHVEPEAYPTSVSPLPLYNLLIFRFNNLRGSVQQDEGCR